jgi:hypothetical protein
MASNRWRGFFSQNRSMALNIAGSLAYSQETASIGGNPAPRSAAFASAWFIGPVNHQPSITPCVLSCVIVVIANYPLTRPPPGISCLDNFLRCSLTTQLSLAPL